MLIDAMNFDFSVVVISHNGKDFLKKCLEALLKSNVKPKKTIVVDDNSSDGTEHLIKENFSDIHYVKNNSNKGPSAARNSGAALVQEEFIIFLDNDIAVREDSIAKLLQFLYVHDDAAIAGGKLINESGKTIRWNMGYDPNFIRGIGGEICAFLFWCGLKTERFKNFSMKFNLNLWDYDHTIRVGWVIESFMAVRTRLFRQVGGFDEKFFMFFEGPDLSRRLRTQGFHTYFVHDAVVFMKEGHTHTPKFRKNVFRKSMRYFYWKHYVQRIFQ